MIILKQVIITISAPGDVKKKLFKRTGTSSAEAGAKWAKSVRGKRPGNEPYTCSRVGAGAEGADVDNQGLVPGAPAPQACAVCVRGESRAEDRGRERQAAGSKETVSPSSSAAWKASRDVRACEQVPDSKHPHPENH